jgi:hypothetical protein
VQTTLANAHASTKRSGVKWSGLSFFAVPVVHPDEDKGVGAGHFRLGDDRYPHNRYSS